MKKKLVLIVFFLVLTNCWMVMSFIGSSGQNYKPVKNFDWLKEYYVFSRTVTTEGWTTHKQMSFDSAGVVQVDGKKNPCTISEFALAAYNRYTKTKEEKFKDHFLNQVKWLLDPRNYQLIGTNMLGHPYLFAFHDLNPPWYGGLAEAEFMSVLIRYYSMSNDKTVLPIIIKTRNFLLTPEEKGGLFSKTPEGNIWIEEYGASKQERHVLNGFFVTVISLYEYCKLFPDDKEAFSVYRECLESIKKSLKYYERQNWVTYNRGDYRLVANWYMKAQVIELQELYRISNDEFFKHMSMLWGSYVFEKPIGRPPGTCLIDNYNFAVPVTNDKGILKPQPSYLNLLLPTTQYTFASNVEIRKDSLKFLTDGNPNTRISVDPLRLNDLPFYTEITFDRTYDFDAVSLIASENIAAIKFQTMDANGSWIPLEVSSTDQTGAYKVFRFSMTHSNRLKVLVTDFNPQQPIALSEIRLHNTMDAQPPEFSFYTSDVLQVDTDKLKISFDTTDVADPVIFFKSAPDNATLNKAVWTYEKFIKGTKVEIGVKENKFFRFMVLYKIKSANSSISNLTVE